jgi:hypothetical protein
MAEVPNPASTTVNVVSRIVLKGMEIFSDERKRYWQDEKFKREKAVADAQNKRAHTGYTDTEVILAEEELERFYHAYEAEYSAKLDEVLAKLKGKSS